MNKNKRAKRAKLKKKLANIERMNTPKETQESKKVYQNMRKRGASGGDIMKGIISYKKETE